VTAAPRRLHACWPPPQAREREAVRGGKRVFHKKRAARRADELRVRFEELKASGRLDKALAKRRRKNAAKDHRYVPSARRGA
jgi:ribosomal RNA-processing protein 36